ncbi:MAG: SsrA-binding protein SmpB [Planctomycetota bacterium]|jgi:SsrA-binding protein|nr:SsrA-binding protein SmpB [Planctomycetota bacterium]
MSDTRKTRKTSVDLPGRTVVLHKKARHRFEVIEEFEAGLVLRGTEVKSLREGKVSLDEAFGRIDGKEAFLVGCHIPEYFAGNRQNHDPLRRRKLLLRRREIKRIETKVTQKGFTVVPLRLYFSDRGFAKVTLGLCRGKRMGDKREVIKRREAERQMRQDL